MKKIIIAIIISINFVAGALFFMFYNEYIVIRFSHSTISPQELIQKTLVNKKQVKMIFWRQGQWKVETQEIIWTDQKKQNITQLLTDWLNLVYEEKIIDQKICLQAVVLAPSNHDVFISFDQNPLPQSGPVIDKLMLLEGLLKTIRDNGIQLQTVQFLVDHQPLKDEHLNFLNPWPITGFLS